jgi:hypothetical protein
VEAQLLSTYSATSTTSDYNILVALELNTTGDRGEGNSRADKLAEQHYKRV